MATKHRPEDGGRPGSVEYECLEERETVRCNTRVAAVEPEVRTLVRLARSGDPPVAMRAMAAISGIVREILDPEVQQQLRARLDAEKRLAPK